jgi:hypothetical protein
MINLRYITNTPLNQKLIPNQFRNHKKSQKRKKEKTSPNPKNPLNPNSTSKITMYFVQCCNVKNTLPYLSLMNLANQVLTINGITLLDHEVVDLS